MPPLAFALDSSVLTVLALGLGVRALTSPRHVTVTVTMTVTRPDVDFPVFSATQNISVLDIPNPSAP